MPVGFWGEMGVAHEIFPEGELFREVEFFGNLFDEQVGLVKQVFGLVDGEWAIQSEGGFPVHDLMMWVKWLVDRQASLA